MNDMHHRRKKDTMVERLGSEDTAIWQLTKSELIRIGKPAVKPLIFALLYEANPTVRWRAAEILGGMQEPEAVTHLINALSDDSSTVRWCSIEALMDMGIQARWELSRALEHENADVRWGALKALEGIESRLKLEEQERLRRLLEDNDILVEAMDDAWYWQLVDGGKGPQMYVPMTALA
jgi:HEAT repeat protein